MNLQMMLIGITVAGVWVVARGLDRIEALLRERLPRKPHSEE